MHILPKGNTILAKEKELTCNNIATNLVSKICHSIALENGALEFVNFFLFDSNLVRLQETFLR